MALKDFNFKQFLMERGERVGLYAAGGLAALLIFTSLIWPGKALFNWSPRKDADFLTTNAKTKKQDVDTKAPGPDEAEQLARVDPKLLKEASSVDEDPTRFRLTAELFAPRDVGSSKRQNPEVLGPEEFQVAFLRAQISSYMLQDRAGVQMLGVITANVKGRKPNRPNDPFGRFGGGMYGGGSRPGAGMGGGFPGAPPGFDPNRRGTGNSFGAPGMPGGGGPGLFAGGGDDKKNNEVRYIPKDEYEKTPNLSPARDLYPLPMVEIAGSFPLAAQVAEFQKALRLDNAAHVVQETVTEKDRRGANAATQRAFRFLGFEVQRRTYGADGKLLDNDWHPLDFENKDKSPYLAVMRLVGHETAKEDPKLEPILFQGLYLHRPPQIPGNGEDSKEKPYPAVEEQLPKIRDTLAKLTPKQIKPPSAPSKFDEGFNPFGAPDPTNDKTPEPEQQVSQEWTPPEHCVVRFLDVTIQPNQSYEYQIKIKMANPNYGKPDTEIAYPALATPRELTSPWFDVKGPDGKPLRVSIPTDVHYYALDEQAYEQEQAKLLNPKLRKRQYDGMNAGKTYEAAHQTVVQLHRWIGQFELTKGRDISFFPVGDWVVAERLLVYRGELLSEKAPTHVPIWAAERSGFMLAGRPVLRGRDLRPTEALQLIKPDRAPLLVDFQGGTMTYHHGTVPAPKTDDGASTDTPKPVAGPEVRMVGTTTEVLLLSPDGKLLAHDTATDEEDETRKTREKEYIDRVDEASGKAPAPKPADKPK